MKHILFVIIRGRRGAGAQGSDCKATVVGSISTRVKELFKKS